METRPQLVVAVSDFLGLSFTVLCMLVNAIGACVALMSLPDPRGVAFLALQALLLAVPLDIRPPQWAQRFITFTFQRAQEYFPVKAYLEDPGAFASNRTYMIGFEPHDVLPLPMFMFSKYARAMPPGLANVRMLGSSACFACPVLRHYWHWSGLRPVSRKTVHHLLSRGVSCVLSPGGVKETQYMRRDKDVAYLRRRTGFVRLALEHGADLVPCWCFGQRDLYSYLRPFIDVGRNLLPAGLWTAVTGRIGFLPMLIWGQGGTPLPRRVPVTLVVGRPIRVERVENPSAEQVHALLERYIAETQRLHAEHKERLGYGHLALHVI